MNKSKNKSNKTKRILFVLHGFPPNAYGGIETHTFQLARELSKRYEIFVFTRVENESKKDFTTYQEDVSGMKVTNVVNNFKWQGNKFTDRFLCKEIDDIFENYIKEVKPQLIHIQHLIGLSCNIIDIANNAKIPIILSLHDYWYGCHRLNLLTNLGTICKNIDDSVNCVECVLKPNITKAINSRIISIIKNWYFPRVKRSILRKVEQDEIISFTQNLTDSISNNIKAVISRRFYMSHILSKCQYLICTTKWVETVYHRFGFDFDNYIVLPPGSNLKTTTDSIESVYQNGNKTFQLGYAGAILPHKGIHILLTALEILKDKGYGNDRLKLSIYGKGVDRKYQDKLDILGEGLNVEFKGSYKHDDLKVIMSGFDLLVVPSIWNETYSLIIREAILCGTPVITTDLAAQKDGITNYKSGLLVKPGDPDDLAEKIEYAIITPDFIINAKKHINNFDIKKIPSTEQYALDISQIYDELLK